MLRRSLLRALGPAAASVVSLMDRRGNSTAGYCHASPVPVVSSKVALTETHIFPTCEKPSLESKGVNFGNRSQEQKLSMMISASYTTAAFLQDSGLHRPFIITSDTGVLEECRMLGITDYFATITDDGKPAPLFQKLDMGSAADVIKQNPNVDSIVVGWDMQLTALKVGTAVNYIKWHEDLHASEPGYKEQSSASPPKPCIPVAGIEFCLSGESRTVLFSPSLQEMPLIACSGDTGGVLGKTTHLGKELKLRAIGNGAMADIIARSFDPPKDALLLLLRSPHAYNVDLNKALMVGDTLQTDIVFGNRGGFLSASNLFLAWVIAGTGPSAMSPRRLAARRQRRLLSVPLAVLLPVAAALLSLGFCRRCLSFAGGVAARAPSAMIRYASTIEGDEFKAARDRIRRIQLGLGPNDPLPEEDDDEAEASLGKGRSGSPNRFGPSTVAWMIRPFRLGFFTFLGFFDRPSEAATYAIDAHGHSRALMRQEATNRQASLEEGDPDNDCVWGDWQEWTPDGHDDDTTGIRRQHVYQ
eukprot:g11123.t1